MVAVLIKIFVLSILKAVTPLMASRGPWSEERGKFTLHPLLSKLRAIFLWTEGVHSLKLVINIPRILKSYIVKENLIGSTVTKILRYRQTDIHRFCYFLFIIFYLLFYSFEPTDVEAMIIFGQTAEEAQVCGILTSNTFSGYLILYFTFSYLSLTMVDVYSALEKWG